MTSAEKKKLRERAASKRYYERHRAEVIARTGEYHKREVEKTRAARRRQYHNRATVDPEYFRARNGKRRARANNAEINDFTAAQWLERLDEYQRSCAYCGAAEVELQREHVVPLSRGGNHTKSNIVPACRDCNYRKGTAVWVPRTPCATPTHSTSHHLTVRTLSAPVSSFVSN